MKPDKIKDIAAFEPDSVSYNVRQALLERRKTAQFMVEKDFEGYCESLENMLELSNKRIIELLLLK